MLKQALKDQLKTAMLAKDELRTSVIRFVLSGITYYEIQKGGAGYEATDEDVLTVISKEAKQRKDSIVEFEKAGREELASKEKSELSILESYLPEQMSEGEVRRHVEEAVKATDAKSPADMGKVMAALMPKVKGKADGGIVSRLVREALQ